MARETDLITQVQETLDRLSVSLFSTTGALQRDAQPVSVRGEPSPKIDGQGSSQDMAVHWAAELLELSKAVDNLLQKFPAVDTTEEEELGRVAAAIEANNRVGDELRGELEITEKLLTQVRSLHAALADSETKRRAQMADPGIRADK